MIQSPPIAVELHPEIDRRTERAPDEDPESVRHLWVGCVRLAGPWCDRDDVWAAGLADQEPQRELVALDTFPSADEFRGRQHVGEPLGLLERQHAKRKPSP